MGFDLAHCRTIIGNVDVVNHEPRIWCGDATVFPEKWGLYDHGRKLVMESAYFRGPVPELIGSRFTLADGWPTDVLRLPAGDYYYIGHIPSHYGHFLLVCLSRLWALKRYPARKFRLVAHPVPFFYDLPFVAQFLESVGYSVEDVAFFPEPTLIPGIVVPAPSFEETNFVHQQFGELCRSCASLIAGPHDGDEWDGGTPVYLAKSKLRTGVANLDNEEVIIRRMERHGVQIVHPETLSLPAQMRMFQQVSCFVGLGGSAFHNAAFVQGKKLLLLNYFEHILSNQLLIDRMGGHQAVHVFSQAGVEAKEAEGFATRFSLREPAHVADDLARTLDAMMDDRPLPVAGWAERGAEWHPVPGSE